MQAVVIDMWWRYIHCIATGMVGDMLIRSSYQAWRALPDRGGQNQGRSRVVAFQCVSIYEESYLG